MGKLPHIMKQKDMREFFYAIDRIGCGARGRMVGNTAPLSQSSHLCGLQDSSFYHEVIVEFKGICILVEHDLTHNATEGFRFQVIRCITFDNIQDRLYTA